MNKRIMKIRKLAAINNLRLIIVRDQVKMKLLMK